MNIMHLHTGRTMDVPLIKTVPVVYHIFDVSSSTGLGIEGCRTCWNDSPYHCPLLLANGTYALALGQDTKPAHHGLVRPDSRRQNLFFPTGHIALDSEPCGRRYVKNMIYNKNRLYSRAIHFPASMEMHYVQWFLLKSMYEITDCAKN